MYVLMAIIKKRLNIDASLYTILQILSLTCFEKIPLNQLLDQNEYKWQDLSNANQLNLFT